MEDTTPPDTIIVPGKKKLNLKHPAVLGGILVVALLITGGSFWFGFQQMNPSPTPTPTPEPTQFVEPTDEPEPTEEPTATPTRRPTIRPTATTAPTSAPTNTPNPTSLPFTVTGVTAAVAPASSSACLTTFNFSATISVNGSGNVTYKWARSDGAAISEQTLSFSGTGNQTVTYEWPNPADTSGETVNGYAELQIKSPNEKTSNRASFTHICP